MQLAQKLGIAAVSNIMVFASIVASSVTSASAFTITTGGTSVPGAGQISSVSNTKTITFDNGIAPTTGYAKYSSSIETPTIVQGTVSGQYATPSGDQTKYLTIAPVGANVLGSNSPITIALAKAANYFGLYWGSVDAYNTVAFYKGQSLLASFTGSNVPGTTASGDQSSPEDNVYVNFFTGQGEEFDKIILASSQVAFESDNHAFKEVPEPLTIGGSILALGFGWWMKRQPLRRGIQN
ncbi:PEP-CTERM sorting domain-containing protein [Calothrix sp. FACHB-156]|nr:PEP-CTERM sorting domain-containing protein [Calothrix sp. FACHB-156]